MAQDGVLRDRGEEGAGHVDVVAGARQRRGEVEAEAVDVHLGRPVAQRVEDQPERAGIGRVDRVATAGHVPVGVARRTGALVEPGVVETAEGVGRPVLTALGGVVVDHVKEDLDAGGVEVLDHLLELRDLLATVARGAVRRVRGQEADGVVAPVVDQPAVGDAGLGEEVVDGQQLDRGDAEVVEVAGDRVAAEPGVGAAQVLGDLVVELGVALDVELVDDRVAPPGAQRPVVAPVEGVVDDDRAGHRAGGVDGAGS